MKKLKKTNHQIRIPAVKLQKQLILFHFLEQHFIEEGAMHRENLMGVVLEFTNHEWCI